MENLSFSNVYCGYGNETLIWHGLKKFNNIIQMTDNHESKENRSYAFSPVLNQHKEDTGNKLVNKIFQGKKIFISSINIAALSNWQYSKWVYSMSTTKAFLASHLTTLKLLNFAGTYFRD